ncbi:kinesin light chain [Delitschia confertaspora ATCC 74209]|uniref:Kinesin light chain n=1 Tax=Delitschia confertaspora ATCC 74209 TaxID=1513339 RepID=A0A9P4MPU4_9PLEO|nr:kinesin light chain [Delitschia confertaspora ATCC 74209]
MTSSKQQLSRTDYLVAWICPVADVELLPARLMLDEEHAPLHMTLVIATCPRGETSNLNAGRLTGTMFKTFPNIRMAVLVGIGGGIPSSVIAKDPLDDIHLGDVVVGSPGDGKPACVYYGRGRSKANGQFEIVGTMQNPDWRLTNALSILISDHELGRTKFDDQLARLRGNSKFVHPGLEYDRLFRAGYHHIGEYGSNCIACDKDELVQRPLRTKEDKNKLVFHQGRIATGNSIIQDGQLRDKISAICGEALCIEMEAAGIDINRKCLVIRGISDYADSHKNDTWKFYTAGNAAAFARELLCRIPPDETQLANLDTHISSEGYLRLAIWGLGGCGKTALALESAYRARERQPDHAVFWVPALSQETFEQAYREIGTLLRIPGIADDKADIKVLVKAWLSDEGFGQWLIIVDNADDASVLFAPPETKSSKDRLIDFLPRSNKGSIVFTTRTRKVAIDLADSNVMELGKLAEEEAEEVLMTRLLPGKQHLLDDNQVVREFLDLFAFLALAIIQAVAFINKNNITLADYMSIYKESKEEAIGLLREEFEDHGRYRDMKNPVATTWYISFKQIQNQNPLATDYLSFMACTTGENIPESLLLPGSSRRAAIEAIGTLDATFDIHRLIYLVTQNWLKEHKQWDDWVNKALGRLIEVVPYGSYKEREVWETYLPHALHLVELPEAYKEEDRMSLLYQVGYCEQTLGRYIAAEAAHQKVLEKREGLLGKEHPSTLASMSKVARALWSQGKYTEAEKMDRETLKLREKVLGKEYPDTLTSMNNLALALSNQGKYAEAEKMDRETLKLREVSGKEHPEK